MPWARILLVVILGIVAVMIITAVIHLIAPYAAALVVLIAVGWAFNRSDNEKPPD